MSSTAHQHKNYQTPQVIGLRGIILCMLTGVNYYEDVFEKLIHWHKYLEELGAFFRGRISTLILEKRILFIHVPRNAGTSISNALYGCSLGHKTAHFYHRADAEMFRVATRFAVLREPVDRFLSAFSFIQNGGGEDVVIDPAFGAKLKKLKTVDCILDFIENSMSDIYQLDYVLRPQSWYLMDRAGNLIIENLFVLGFHDKELREFLKAVDISELQVLNRTRREAIELTPSQLQRVQSIYRLDISLLEQVKINGPVLEGAFSVKRLGAGTRTLDQSFYHAWVSREEMPAR